MVLDIGPRPQGDPAAIRAFARTLIHAADGMDGHAAKVRGAKLGSTGLGFTGPSASKLAARIKAWAVLVDRDADSLRELAARVMAEAGTLEQGQRSHDQAVERQRVAEARGR